MKLSNTVLTVLKNFSTINSGMVIRPGKVQKTISADKSILVEASFEDADFPSKFGIYDLNQFLGNVTTLTNPDLIFQDKFVVMDDGSTKLNYYSCAPELIDTPPDKELVIDSPIVTFTLHNTVLAKLLRLSSMNNLSNLTFEGGNGELTIKVHEKKNDTSNFASHKISDYDGDSFTAIFKTENLKMIPGDYEVQIKDKAFATFTSTNGNIKYFVALETP